MNRKFWLILIIVVLILTQLACIGGDGSGDLVSDLEGVLSGSFEPETADVRYEDLGGCFDVPLLNTNCK